MTNEDKERLMAALETVHFNNKEAIVNEGEIGDSIYLVEAGEAIVLKDGAEVHRYKPGGYFGELLGCNPQGEPL